VGRARRARRCGAAARPGRPGDAAARSRHAVDRAGGLPRGPTTGPSGSTTHRQGCATSRGPRPPTGRSS
jgi:hypothetical protein